ncbi:MAG: hypothetical protein ABI599_11755 [Flavobacteriales bacterium]
MLTDKEYVIRLNGFDLGQLVDGLEARAAAWRNTATYLNTGETPTDDFVAEECTDGNEAQQLAEHYHRIIAVLLKQQAYQDRP